MSILREVPPTAGFPLRIEDILSLFTGSGEELEDDFRRYIGAGYARVTCSGTAAFYLILECLKKISGKRTVIVPSFICPLIPLAIERAGLRVEPCDINRDNLDLDLRMLEDLCSRNSDILAVLAVHLAGIPADFDALEDIAKSYGIFTIEDCAQALGARYKGRQVGSSGDFSFYSLSRGKGLTTYEGGALVANRREYRALIDDTIRELVRGDALSEIALTALLFGYWVFYRPLLFWFVFRLPQVFWRWRRNPVKAAQEDFAIDFPLHTMSSARQMIGHSQFPRIEDEIGEQRRKAFFYLSRLRDIKGLTVIEELPGDRATYPYVTILFDSPEKREEAASALGRACCGASFVYAFAVADYDYLHHIVPDRNCANARSAAERAITLSTSTFLDKQDMETAVKIIEGLARR